MNLTLSPAAVLDLQSIAFYTLQTWGEEQEKRYLKGLWMKLGEIRKRPEMHRLRNELGTGCRCARHGKHVIFFTWDHQEIEVIRILHQAMDFNILFSDEPL